MGCHMIKSNDEQHRSCETQPDLHVLLPTSSSFQRDCLFFFFFFFFFQRLPPVTTRHQCPVISKPKALWGLCRRPSGGGSTFCSGTLLSPRAAVTPVKAPQDSPNSTIASCEAPLETRGNLTNCSGVCPDGPASSAARPPLKTTTSVRLCIVGHHTDTDTIFLPQTISFYFACLLSSSSTSSFSSAISILPLNSFTPLSILQISPLSQSFIFLCHLYKQGMDCL